MKDSETRQVPQAAPRKRAEESEGKWSCVSWGLYLIKFVSRRADAPDGRCTSTRSFLGSE